MPSTRRTHRVLAIGLILILATSIGACTSARKAPAFTAAKLRNRFDAAVDPVFQINSISTSPEASDPVQTAQIPDNSIYIDEQPEEQKKDEGGPITPVSKISPVLQEWVNTGPPDKEVEIIVTFEEDMHIPLLPELRPWENRDRGRTERGDAIESLKRQRDTSQAAALGRLAAFGRFRALEGFWIVNSVVLVTTLGQVNRLADSAEVVYLQPVEGGEEPPQDANNDNDAEDARAHINSDPYFDWGLPQPGIGLLDTGVRETHVLFNTPDHIAWMRDCVGGGENCDNTVSPLFDPEDHHDHGTSSAGVLAGNRNLGNRFRGATEIRTDSWKIYNTAGGLNATATIWAIQASLAAFDRVLVCVLQAYESEFGAIATAADNAYDAGQILVAANGNFGPAPKTVRSPASAHKVLGVGAFHTEDGSQYVSQGRGPTSDGRYKPDIQAPTASETAGSASDTALKVYKGTSGATPYAGSAAMLAHNWLRRLGTRDNGQVYAFMILYGQDPLILSGEVPWQYSNTVGAGRIRMATDGWAWWGKVEIRHQVNCDIPIKLWGGNWNLDVALWWPESATQVHSDIDVMVIDPDGVERAKGTSRLSVFERARVSGDIQAGTWTVRIRGERVPEVLQTVYWAAHVSRATRFPDPMEELFLRVFEGESFYAERREREETLVGVLRSSPVLGLPGTRELPFKLVVGEEELGVYVVGLDEEVLEPFVGRRVEVVGKRVDLTDEGFGAEIWIATIRERRD